MPKGTVKSKKDEAAWNKAKQLVHKQYPNLSEDDESFWKIVNTIYESVRKAKTEVKTELMLKAVQIADLYVDNLQSNKDLAKDIYYVVYLLLKSEKDERERLNKARKLQGRIDFQGLPISIENRKGTIRKGTDPDGHEWKTKMKCPYGYIRLTEGADGEHVDCYIGPNKQSNSVYVINQVDPYKDDKPFDEQKVMLGFNSAETAKKAYLVHYDRDDFFGNMYEYDMDTFKNNLGLGKKGVTGVLLKRKKGKIK